MSRTVVPHFSLVVPTYRRSHLLGRALASVLAQEWDDFEVVVVDDGAEAATRDVVVAIEDHRFRYLPQPRSGGAAAARNTGIELARGRWVLFLDDDDELLPGMLENVARRLATADPPLGFLWCGIRMVRDTPDGEVFIEERLWGEHFDRPPGAPPLGERERRQAEYDASRIGTGFGLVVRRDLLEELGGFDASLRFAEDTDLFLRLLALGATFDAIRDAQVVIHRVSGGSLSDTTPAPLRIASVERVIERNHAMLRQRPHLEAKLWETLGREYARAGRSGAAWKTAGRLLLHHPTTIHAWRMVLRAIYGRRG